MARFIVAILSFLGFAAFATTPEVKVSLEDFAHLTKGEYEVLKSDGHETEYKDGEVADEDEELVLTFPYCPKGGNLCDPGYVFLPKKPVGVVRIIKKEIKGVGELYSIHHQDGLDEYNYEWQVPAKSIDPVVFRKLNYVYGTRAPFTLEFEIEKKKATP